MSLCHLGQDIFQAAKNTRILKHQNYAGKLQDVLTKDKTEFSLHKSTRNSKKSAVEKASYIDEIFS